MASERIRRTERFLHSMDFAKGFTSVASANNLSLGRGVVFDITGTTTINYLETTGIRTGRFRILRFNGTLTVKNNLGSPGTGFANLKLIAGADFSAAAGKILGFVYDGTNWQQVF